MQKLIDLASRLYALSQNPYSDPSANGSEMEVIATELFECVNAIAKSEREMKEQIWEARKRILDLQNNLYRSEDELQKQKAAGNS